MNLRALATTCLLAAGLAAAADNRPNLVYNWIGYHEIVGVRTKDAKLVYYPTWKDGPFWEYFDLRQDPREMHNLYGEPSRQEAAAAIKARFRDLAAHYRDMEVVQRLDAEKKRKP